MGTGGSKNSASVSRFTWGVVGDVIIRSVRYTGMIDQLSDTTKVKLPKNRVTESKLSWVNNEYMVEDLRTIDLDNSKTVEFPSLQARFRVGQSEDFESLIYEDELVSMYSANIKKRLSPEQRAMLIEKVTNQCKELWSNTRTIWLKHKSMLGQKQIKHCSMNCIELSLSKAAASSELNSYITAKYNPDVIGEVSRTIKAKLIVEKESNRPHLAFIRKSSYAELKKSEQVISEVKEEITLMVYCWEEVASLSSENFIKSEVRKMNEIVNFQLKDFDQRLKHRVKSKIL